MSSGILPLPSGSGARAAGAMAEELRYPLESLSLICGSCSACPRTETPKTRAAANCNERRFGGNQLRQPKPMYADDGRRFVFHRRCPNGKTPANLMGRAGLEPATLGLKVPCSTS